MVNIKDKDNNMEMIVLTDRSEGVTSMINGTIDILI